MNFECLLCAVYNARDFSMLSICEVYIYEVDFGMIGHKYRKGCSYKITQWLSRCGLWISDINAIWELVTKCILKPILCTLSETQRIIPVCWSSK